MSAVEWFPEADVLLPQDKSQIRLDKMQVQTPLSSQCLFAIPIDKNCLPPFGVIVAKNNNSPIVKFLNYIL